MTTVMWIVSGRVQGVGYRFFVRMAAGRLGIAGTVRNLPTGQVEVVAQGTPAALQTLLGELWRGPSRALVSDVAETNITGTAHRTSGFSIIS